MQSYFNEGRTTQSYGGLGPSRDAVVLVSIAAGGAMSETRKLAAILVADVVGYSRLAGADEDRILARLRALRSDLIDPTIAVHRGRVVKRTGDGSIVEFRSVVDAVRCAIEVQNDLRGAGSPKLVGAGGRPHLLSFEAKASLFWRDREVRP